jgi:hypothetical protein
MVPVVLFYSYLQLPLPPLHATLNKPFPTYFVNNTMAKIKSIEYFRVKPRWLMVKITDDAGQYGWGEGTLEGHDLAVEGALEEMIVRLIGQEAKYVIYSH